MPEHDDSNPRHARAAAVAGHFARLAQSYGGGEYYARRRAAVMRAIRPELIRARRGLDLGCGNGRYLREFRNISPAAFFCGADLTAEMLAEARTRTGGGLVRADACALPFRTGAFDLIFASHVLPFVADIDGVVRGIARCLAPGGVLAATAARGRMMGAALHTMMGEERWKRFSPAVFGAVNRTGAESEQLHRRAFEGAGLRIEIRSARFEISWAGVEEWVRLRWLPFATAQEEAEVARVFSEIAAAADRGPIALEELLLLGRR